MYQTMFISSHLILELFVSRCCLLIPVYVIQKTAGQAHFQSGYQPKLPYNQEASQRTDDDPAL